MSEGKNVVIVAPHVDDECIGCYSIISNQTESIHIVYGESPDIIRRGEALALKSEFINIKSQHFCTSSIPPIFLNPKTTFYFPDPFFEIHPKHREWGAIGESLLRNGLDVIFYSVLMNTPYIFEVKEWVKKREVLDKIYPSQKDLWSGGNGQYYLMEGYCKWILKI